jgi:hypothetical protein
VKEAAVAVLSLLKKRANVSAAKPMHPRKEPSVPAAGCAGVGDDELNQPIFRGDKMLYMLAESMAAFVPIEEQVPGPDKHDKKVK